MSSELSTCKACGKNVAKSVSRCPHCGETLKKTSNLKKLLVGSIVLMAILTGYNALSGNSDKSISQNGQSIAKTQTLTPSKSQVATPYQQTSRELLWNFKDINVKTNGNIQVAVIKLRDYANSKDKAIQVDVENIFKRPWEHYGKIVKISGQAVIVQDYPPEGDIAKAFGGSAGEIVLVAGNGSTLIDFVIAGSTGNVKVGDQIAIYGYPVGLIDVQNKLGGKTTELAVVGNKVEFR